MHCQSVFRLGKKWEKTAALEAACLPPYMNPRRVAIVMACVRSLAPSFSMMRLM